MSDTSFEQIFHLAFITPGENTSNEWLEPVTDEEYRKLPTGKEKS